MPSTDFSRERRRAVRLALGVCLLLWFGLAVFILGNDSRMFERSNPGNEIASDSRPDAAAGTTRNVTRDVTLEGAIVDGSANFEESPGDTETVNILESYADGLLVEAPAARVASTDEVNRLAPSPRLDTVVDELSSPPGDDSLGSDSGLSGVPWSRTGAICAGRC